MILNAGIVSCLCLDEQPSVSAPCKGISHFISAACDDSTALFLILKEDSLPSLFCLA